MIIFDFLDLIAFLLLVVLASMVMIQMESQKLKWCRKQRAIFYSISIMTVQLVFDYLGVVHTF